MNNYLSTTIFNSEGIKLGELNIDPITGDYFVILDDSTYDYYEGTTEFFD